VLAARTVSCEPRPPLTCRRRPPRLPAQTAFQGVASNPAKLIHAIVADGLRPTFPEGTPEWYSSLAARCWAAAPRARPSFRRIAAHLAGLPPGALLQPAAAPAPAPPPPPPLLPPPAAAASPPRGAGAAGSGAARPPVAPQQQVGGRAR
jgi:hypothetical protein